MWTSQRGRDALCLSVVSFNSTTPRAQFLLLVTSASDLPVRTIRLFCCLRRNVKPCCHTHNSRSTVTVYSMRLRLVGLALYSHGRLLIACGTWWSNTRSQPLSAIYKPPCSSYWLQGQIFVENRDFSLLHLRAMPPLGGFLSKYCQADWYRKTRMAWLPDGEKFWRYVYPFWHNPRTWQTDTTWRLRLHLMLASHGKNWSYIHICIWITTKN